ncbi:MAPEG family protein [Burkholderiaceae bacterium DAT-1]|nr:MAPEG family protein [Burkholderiaceae bacterium DAT-1]
MQLTITGLYGGILALILFVLSARIVALRFKHRVGIGDGNLPELALAIRAHGNFIEYTPFALLLLACNELNHAPLWLLHVAGLILILARLSHALAISQSRGVSIKRTFGMIGTFTVLLVLGISAILQGFGGILHV